MFGNIYSFTTIFILLLLLLSYVLFKMKTSDDFWKKIPGPKPRYPFLGNLDMCWIRGVPINQSSAMIISALVKIYENYGFFKIYFGVKPFLIVFKQNIIKSILSSNVNIDKSDEYRFVNDWLGNGLLLNNRLFWKERRRMLTPAFHFKILEQFIPIMNEQTNILVNKLRKTIRQPFIDIREPIVECTLDIICETAMGVSIGAQVGKNKEYINAIHKLGKIIMKRSFMPWIWSDFIFYKTSMGEEFNSNLNILHSMTRNVIKERKDYIISNKKEISENINQNNIYVSNKPTKRMAFLDLLLDYHINNNSLSLEDIREEVDTFMFEGHDTTAVSLAWTLYLLGLHPEIQIKIQEELETIFGEDIHRDITSEDLKQMNYLECVIKESLRLFPSVPLIGRTLNEDIKCEDFVIPKNTTVYLLINHLHYDTEYFSHPFHFKPERFKKKITSNINAYSYAPFSAGPRNCIGQRFALIEEKLILAKILLNYNLKSLDPRDRIIVSQEFIYRSKLPLRIQIILKDKLK